jgi:hypothetical protein
MTRVVCLGPQRFVPTVRDTVESLGVAGAVAVVTAGWQEREGEHEELRTHLGREVPNLLLYHRYEDVMARDRELAAAAEERQDRLKRVQRWYRLRLDYALDAARELMRRSERDPLLDDQRRSAIRTVRSLDREHLRRIRRIHQEFEARWRPSSRYFVAVHRDEMARQLASAGAVAIAGGHVAVLVNRLRLFGIADLVGDRVVVAWSAGAMAVCDRIVLFHDSPPQGAGNTEVFDAGLGLCHGLVPLPHARKRLQLDDPVRVSVFARRFAPAVAVVLEPGSRIDWDGTGWSWSADTVALGQRGRLRRLATA